MSRATSRTEDMTPAMRRNEKTKSRKPMVDKMRRVRINSSIEQLKLLLKDEFRVSRPGFKWEKADILEMAVSYLRSSTLSPEQSYTDGFARCLEETSRFLMLHCQPKTNESGVVKQLGPTLNPKPTIQTTCIESVTCVKKCPSANIGCKLWRPW